MRAQGSVPGDLRGLAGEMRDALTESRKPRVVGLPALESQEDLLNDGGDLEDREHLVEPDGREVAARLPRVPLENLVAR